jgi:Rps23 Pro-64 3,4-dihydroxylase Tpa1-like proline 4-hydroxylase
MESIKYFKPAGNMDDKFEELIGTYIQNRIGISNHFITKELAQNLRRNLLLLDEEDKMKTAGIGNRFVQGSEQDKRGDRIFWIDNQSDEPSERAFLKQVDLFIEHLNETCYTGINAYEFHYALYETGSYYQRHVDQFQNNSDRKFSLIHYLNTDWMQDEGGELLIYHDNNTEKIFPEMQKAVFFRSKDCEHEVSKSTRPRMSISGWLKSI